MPVAAAAAHRLMMRGQTEEKAKKMMTTMIPMNPLQPQDKCKQDDIEPERALEAKQPYKAAQQQQHYAGSRHRRAQASILKQSAPMHGPHQPQFCNVVWRQLCQQQHLCHVPVYHRRSSCFRHRQLQLLSHKWRRMKMMTAMKTTMMKMILVKRIGYVQCGGVKGEREVMKVKRRT